MRQRSLGVVLVTLLFAALSRGSPTPRDDDDAPVVTQTLVDTINSATTLWRASLDTPTARMTRAQALARVSHVDSGRTSDTAPVTSRGESYVGDLPKNFDVRDAWPNCSVLRHVRDQGHCGSCFAVAAASVISGRECIVNGRDVLLSAEEALACAGAGGCSGGTEEWVFDYWVKKGLVTESCKPYSVAACDHHIPSPNQCPENTSHVPTPKCSPQCVEGSGEEWQAAKHFGSSRYFVWGEQGIMQELVTHGPVEGGFTVYTDLYAYRSGIYHHVAGDKAAEHAITILGYGEEADGTKWWRIMNSWNEHWGESGTFRMLRGARECGIESRAVAGTPVTH